MKSIIRLTECPHCQTPLAAIYPYGGDGQGYFVPIDGATIDLAQPGLIWCKTCGGVLPVPATLQEATQQRRTVTA